MDIMLMVATMMMYAFVLAIIVITYFLALVVLVIVYNAREYWVFTVMAIVYIALSWLGYWIAR